MVGDAHGLSAELVQLMMKYQRRIFAYIHTLVPTRSDAEDILQEASLTICEKFSDFKTGTNFYSWACQIAYWKVRAARKKFATSKVLFNQEILDVISQTRIELDEELDHRHGALSRCLKKLNVRPATIPIPEKQEPTPRVNLKHEIRTRSHWY